MMWTRVPIYNPVVVREVRTRLRGWRSTILIMVYMIVFGAIAGGFLIQQASLTIGQASQMGVKLFIGLASLQLLLTLLITPSSTATALSGERQRQTWDLMLVTRLSTFRIAWGKLVSGLAFSVLLMFAALPIFSFVFLFGGVEIANILHVYLVTIVTALLIGSMSILISSATQRVVGSVIAANIAVLIPTVGLTAFTVYLETTERHVYYRNGQGYFLTHPPLTPFAQLDPLIAFVSALPKPDGGSYLGGLGRVHNAFGVFGTMPQWEAYCILATLVSLGLTALAGRIAGWRGPGRARGGS